jgi:hypothetical protein
MEWPVGMMVVMTPRELMIAYLAAARRGDWDHAGPGGDRLGCGPGRDLLHGGAGPDRLDARRPPRHDHVRRRPGRRASRGA